MAFDFKKLNQREKTLLGILLIIVSTIPFFQYTIPTWNKYTEARQRTKDDKSKLRDLDLKIKTLEKLKNENISILKKLDFQKMYLAKSYEIDFLVQDLKKICDESSISLDSFTPSTAEPVNIVLEKQLEEGSQNRTNIKQALDKLKGQDLPIDLYRFPIEVKVSGDFTDIIELFKKLERYGRVISVDNISIGKIQSKKFTGNRLSKSSSKKQTTDTGSLLGTFDLIAYSLPDSNETLSVKELQRNLNSSKSGFKFTKKR